jgi:hypothetical protein
MERYGPTLWYTETLGDGLNMRFRPIVQRLWSVQADRPHPDPAVEGACRRAHRLAAAHAHGPVPPWRAGGATPGPGRGEISPGYRGRTVVEVALRSVDRVTDELTPLRPGSPAWPETSPAAVPRRLSTGAGR